MILTRHFGVNGLTIEGQSYAKENDHVMNGTLIMCPDHVFSR